MLKLYKDLLPFPWQHYNDDEILESNQNGQQQNCAYTYS